MNSDQMKATVEQWKASLMVFGKPNEWEGKQLVKDIGIAVPTGLFLGPTDPLETESVSDFSFPCVAKVCSGEILHKTEEGGVMLNLSEIDLLAAVEKLRVVFPNAGVLVEEMVRFKDTEVIIGALNDPTFGPAVMVGAGGILTELYKDVSFRLAPCSQKEALRMIRELIIAPALEGYRGLTADIGALASIIEKVADLSVYLIGDGCQLDINPIVWDGTQWVALDVKVVI
jgi:acyl-CoA synthetase (NDP forming)